jgi:hypothetical protein
MKRAAELFEGDDGRLDEQAVLSILLGCALVFFEGWVVLVRHEMFDALGFASACTAFLTGSLGMLTVRSRFAQGRSAASAGATPVESGAPSPDVEK